MYYLVVRNSDNVILACRYEDDGPFVYVSTSKVLDPKSGLEYLDCSIVVVDRLPFSYSYFLIRLRTGYIYKYIEGKIVEISAIHRVTINSSDWELLTDGMYYYQVSTQSTGMNNMSDYIADVEITESILDYASNEEIMNILDSWRLIDIIDIREDYIYFICLNNSSPSTDITIIFKEVK